MTTTNAVPNPGSDAATMRGCKCPVIDNHYGAGFPTKDGRAFYISVECEMHGGGPWAPRTLPQDTPAHD